MDQVPRKWGPGLKANEGNVSATEPSRTLRSRGREYSSGVLGSTRRFGFTGEVSRLEERRIEEGGSRILVVRGTEKRRDETSGIEDLRYGQCREVTCFFFFLVFLVF